MHGEYKTPGGKLVVVDFDLVDGVLRNVVVSGDFFLYPEESLESITGSLEGVPSETDEAGIAEAVRREIPSGTELLGTSPEGIAIAVQRALLAGTRGA
jgi:lipoate-protein ligase A